MILIIGEILIDELPEGPRPGGAPFNVAQHLTRLGVDARLLSRVGRDATGDDLISTMKSLGMRTEHMQRDPARETGRVHVKLSGRGIPTYTIVEDVAYDHIEFHPLASDLETCGMIGFGSLIQRTEAGCRKLQHFLASAPSGITKLYDMNLRPGCDHPEVVFPSLEKTDVLKINDEELEHTGRLLGASMAGDSLVRHLMRHFGIHTVALTMGAAGSALFIGAEKWEVPATPLQDEEMADTVGAGDSFTAVLAYGIARGLAPEDLLARANRLAGRVCTVRGAVPEDDGIYDDIK